MDAMHIVFFTISAGIARFFLAGGRGQGGGGPPPGPLPKGACVAGLIKTAGRVRFTKQVRLTRLDFYGEVPERLKGAAC